MTRDLPPLSLLLTPSERTQAALIALHLEAMRREANARDRRRAEILERIEIEAALEAV